MAIKSGIKNSQCPQNSWSSLFPYPQIKWIIILYPKKQRQMLRSTAFDLINPQTKNASMKMMDKL